MTPLLSNLGLVLTSTVCAPASKTGFNFLSTSFVMAVPSSKTTFPSTSTTSCANIRPEIRSNKLNFLPNLKRPAFAKS